MRNKDNVIRILLLLFFFSFTSDAATGMNEKKIELTAGYSKPPFVIESQKNDKGIQLDLITEIFSLENRPVSFIHVPLARSFSPVNKWHTDGVITLPITHQQKDVYLSEPYISYQNVVVTLAEDDLQIDELDDLSGKYIVAFQTARQFLGTSYSEAIEKSAGYQEVADQMRQIKLLFNKRTQALVLDINILQHFLFNHRDDEFKKPYKIHYLFAPRTYAAGFKSKVIRDQFNRGLTVIKANGKYQAVLDKYLL